MEEFVEKHKREMRELERVEMLEDPRIKKIENAVKQFCNKTQEMDDELRCKMDSVYKEFSYQWYKNWS